MQYKQPIAEELAARLNDLGLGEFAARDGLVTRDGGQPLTLHPIGAGRGRPYEVERVLTQSESLPLAVIVGTDFTPGAMRLLEQRRANYVDRRRVHIHLSDPEFFVHVEAVGAFGRDDPERSLPSLAGATGAVVLSLLEAPDAKHQVTVIANQARVSAATAQKVLFGLEAEGMLMVAGRGPNKVRTLTDPSALLDRYAADAAADRRLAVRCRVLGDDPLKIVEAAVEGLTAAGVSYCVTGTVAALLEAPALTTVARPELWVHGPRTPEYLLRAVDGIASEDGGNLLLWRATTTGPMAQCRYGANQHLRLASRFRVYADLLANPQRGREQAEVYRERIIGF
ncbi:MAG: hypothetical protein Q8S43_11220 [Actinomycetota bacterium]|nr:hypothetical protein [Actinomycetota bacterium]MDP3631504.1 hypothetical protein [Actinomycetota bacterium]